MHLCGWSGRAIQSGGHGAQRSAQNLCRAILHLFSILFFWWPLWVSKNIKSLVVLCTYSEYIWVVFAQLAHLIRAISVLLRFFSFDSYVGYEERRITVRWGFWEEWYCVAQEGKKKRKNILDLKWSVSETAHVRKGKPTRHSSPWVEGVQFLQDHVLRFQPWDYSRPL